MTAGSKSLLWSIWSFATVWVSLIFSLLTSDPRKQTHETNQIQRKGDIFSHDDDDDNGDELAGAGAGFMTHLHGDQYEVDECANPTETNSAELQQSWERDSLH